MPFGGLWRDCPIIGRVLAGIEYFDMSDEYGNPVTAIDPDNPVHEVSQGLDLLFRDGFRCGFGWDGQGGEYDIGFFSGGFSGGMDPNVTIGSVDASHLAPWKVRLGGRVKSVRFGTEFCPDCGPCDALLEFEAPVSPVWISARNTLNGMPYAPNSDDTVITFTPADARRVGITLMP